MKNIIISILQTIDVNLEINDNSIFTKEEIEEFKSISLNDQGAHRGTDFEIGYVFVYFFETLMKKTIEKSRLKF
jgi:hypothetical protein